MDNPGLVLGQGSQTATSAQLLTVTPGQSRAAGSSQHSMPDYFLSFPMQVSHHHVIPQ